MNYCKLVIFILWIIGNILTICSCSNEETHCQFQQKESIEIYLTDNEGGVFFPFLEDDNTIFIKVPRVLNFKPITPVLKINEITFLPDSIFQDGDNRDSICVDFSDFVHPIRIVSKRPDGSILKKKIVLFDIPIIVVDTPDGNPILSKEERTDSCRVKIISDDGIEDLGYAGIKGRGNSTWLEPKKPYNVKLEKKNSILGMKKSKHWLLLANNNFDRTQLHNATAFEMARTTDYPWVQDGRFAEFILNGEHKGLYYVCEKICVEKTRIDIDKMTTDDIEGENLTGGYLIESRRQSVSDVCWQTDYFTLERPGGSEEPLCWVVKSPDQEDGEILVEQLDYIKSHLNYMESLIFDEEILATGKYKDYFDIETAINWLLVEEAALNMEAIDAKNVYMYKKRGDDKIYMGPPWDFDAWTFGSRGMDTFWASRSGLYFYKLLKDPVFVKRLKEKWINYRDKWKMNIPSFIDKQASYIRKAALRNERMWPDWSYVNQYPQKSWDELIEEMKAALLNQIEWMDQQYKQDIFTN